MGTGFAYQNFLVFYVTAYDTWMTSLVKLLRCDWLGRIGLLLTRAVRHLVAHASGSDWWLHHPRWVGWLVRYLDIYLFCVYVPAIHLHADLLCVILEIRHCHLFSKHTCCYWPTPESLMQWVIAYVLQAARLWMAALKMKLFLFRHIHCRFVYHIVFGAGYA